MKQLTTQSSDDLTPTDQGPMTPLTRLPGVSTHATDEAATVPEGRADPSMLRRDSRYRRLLALADAGAAALSVLVVFVLPAQDPSPVAFLVVPFVVLAAKVFGLYDRDQHVLHKTTLDEAPSIVQVSGLALLFLWLTESVSLSGNLGQGSALVLAATLVLSTLVARGIARGVARRTIDPERCLLIGDAETADRVRDRLFMGHALDACLVGWVSSEPHEQASSDPPLLGRPENLGLILAEEDIDRVLIAPGGLPADEILESIRLSRAIGVKVSVLPRLFEVIGASVEQDDIQGVTLLGVRPHGLTASSLALKRIFDLAGALFLLVLLSPLFAAIALAVKLSSPGPVFFRQPRIGRDRASFRVVKFRTMRKDADREKAALLHLNETDGFFKMAEDPRVTRVGRVLRRTSLDEFPQLLNVLRGDMSLVGPRPLVGDEDARIEGWKRARAMVPPGMTGPWQVLGSSRIPMAEMVKIDYLYGANWSLWLDVKILLRTVSHVLGRRGL